MKIVLSKESIATFVLLVLLLVNAAASMIILVSARGKDNTVYIHGSGSVELTWKSGKSQTYSSDAYVKLGGLDTVTMIPSRGWHINACIIDGNPQEIVDEDGFSLIDVQAKNTVSVIFFENGGVDDVEFGSSVEAYPDPDVGVIFDNVLEDGFVYAYTIGLQPPDAKGESWDIHTDATFDPDVTVILVLNLVDLGGSDPATLTMLRTEYELARSDVNSDGRVDGDDVSDVANANPSEEGDPEYEARLDINDDRVIDDLDVNIVNNYNNEAVWEPLETDFEVVNGLVYVYGVSDHLSIFGIH